MRILSWVLAVVLAVGLCWWLYSHTTPRSVATSGDVFSHGTAIDNGTDIDGNPIKADNATAQPAPSPSLATPVSAATTPAVTNPAPVSRVAVSTPASDTLDRNAPAGMAFGGSGKYQWYRQGNITWRIDTHSGNSCVEFATMDEWTKPVVYSNGCRYRS